jgi:L-amino acid N-acyltransferase
MIRPASEADAPALAALWNPWIINTAITFNPVAKTAADIAAMIRERQAAGHGFWVAEAATLLGFVTYAQFRGGLGYATCMEHTVILSPEARGRGVGRALMQAMEAHAVQAGAHQMIAGVSGENLEGRAFHTRMGYREVAVITEAGYKFGRFMDLVLMQKFLT